LTVKTSKSPREEKQGSHYQWQLTIPRIDKMKHLSHDQIDALIAAAESDRDRLLFRLCYEHGLRISECLALTRANAQRDFLTIKAKKRGKRSEERLSAASIRLWASVTETLAPNTRGSVGSGHR
jgi:integrase